MQDQPTITESSHKTRRANRLYAALAAVVFVVLVVAVFKLVAGRNDQVPVAAKIAVVHITDRGFEPATISVKQGTKVIWTNTDSGLHQVASNPYPLASGLPGLKSEILNNTQTYTYIADTVGSFGYHDQLQPTVNGTLVVQK